VNITRTLLFATGLSLFGAGACSSAPAVDVPEAEKYFTAEDIARGGTRARQSRALWIVAVLWSIGALVVLSHPRVGTWFVSVVWRVVGSDDGASTARRIAGTVATIAGLLVAYFLLRGPFVWARGFFLEHAWDLSNQTAGAFLWDWVKAVLVTTVMYTVAIAAIVVLRGFLPTWWPVAGWAATSAFIVFMVLVYPVAIDPLFHTFTPVTETEVRERAQRIAEKAGLEIGEVLWVDASSRTKRTNAYFTGLGATKRIVLYDTLKDEDGSVSTSTLDEVETILAHEAGHWRGGHMLKGTALAVLGTGVFFLALWLLTKSGASWLPDASLPAGARLGTMVLLLATALQYLSMPVVNAISRSWEREADSASLELSGKPEAFIRAEVELSRRNISQIRPGAFAVFWLYTHPPVLERIAMAERYRAEREASPAGGE